MTLTQAQIAAIKALEDAEGRITPRQIFEAAKSKSSPLHGLYDWNQKHAAEKWWMHQSRLILGAMTIQVTTQEFSYKASAYMVDTSVKGQGYRSVLALKSDTDSARESLIFTLETAAGHLRRALDLAAPLGLSGEIDLLLERIAGVTRSVRKEAA